METAIPRRFLRALLRCDDFAPLEVVDWASELRRTVSADAVHPLVAELASANPKTAAGCNHIMVTLQLLAEEWYPDFENLGPLAESIAKEVLAQKGRLLLDRKIQPDEFCWFVRHFDAIFLDQSFKNAKLNNMVAEYPKWLGNLWKACDWVGGNWRPTLDEIPMLADEVRKLVPDLPDPE